MKSCRWQQTAKRLITFGLSLVLIWGLIPVGSAEEYAELLPPEVVSYLEAASEAYGVISSSERLLELTDLPPAVSRAKGGNSIEIELGTTMDEAEKKI